MDYVIELNNVSKNFRLYTQPIDRLKESLHPFRKKFHHEHQVLKNITFSISRGETVGIMGKNGAGKSTLLQLITSVLEPSEGVINVNGQISAMLELGAGFNPEMTGRENVLAQALLMGMSRRQMAMKFSDIEEFADIGEYIDQPVKNYSSGMFVRLAFAMFISIEPDILIIDEALAVGDAAFQEKCFRKLKEFKDEGKTFLLVSHSASMVSSLCDRVIVLDNSRISFDGGPRLGLTHYGQLLFEESASVGSGANLLAGKSDVDVNMFLLGNTLINTEEELVKKFLSNKINTEIVGQWPNQDEMRSGDRETAFISDYLVLNDNRVADSVLPIDCELSICIKVAALKNVENPRVSISFRTPNGFLVYGVNSDLLGLKLNEIKGGEVVIFLFTLKNKFYPGAYMMSLGLVDDSPVNPKKLDVRESIATIEVSGAARFNGIINLEPKFFQVDLTSFMKDKS